MDSIPLLTLALTLLTQSLGVFHTQESKKQKEQRESHNEKIPTELKFSVFVKINSIAYEIAQIPNNPYQNRPAKELTKKRFHSLPLWNQSR